MAHPPASALTPGVEARIATHRLSEELKGIQDPDLFLYGIARAIEQKRQRLTSEGTRMPTNAGGTGSHNPNPIENIDDNDELWELAEKKHNL